MNHARIWVVHVYRQSSRRLVGVLEESTSGRATPFRNAKELLAFLREARGTDSADGRGISPSGNVKKGIEK